MYLDLFVYERPSCNPTDEEWKSCPLVFHDKGLVSAANDMIKGLPKGLHDFTKTITKILKRHPGPISYFRLDSSTCAGPQLLETWEETLSRKAVCNMLVVNRSEPTDTPFPLHLLELDGSSKGLTVLALGYFSVHIRRDDLLPDRFSSLSELILEGCIFNGNALSTLIYECTALDILKITDSNLTDGYHGPFSIFSRTLETVQLLRCRANSLNIKYAPVLCSLTTDISPAKGKMLPVDIQHCDALKELYCVALHLHDVCLTSDFSTMNQGRKIPSVDSLECLNVILAMNEESQTMGLVELLRHFPGLKELTLEAVDRAQLQVSAPRAKASDSIRFLRCARRSLQRVLIKNYRGRPGEVDLLTKFLMYSRKLICVEVHAAGAAETYQALNECPRASKKCKIVFLP